MATKSKPKSPKQIIPKGIVDPVGDTPVDDFFRVVDREKLQLALATVRVMADSDCDINIYGPHRFINELCSLKEFPKVTEGQCYVSFLPGAEGKNENGEVVLNFEEFGLVPLRDVDLVYYDIWNGRIPAPAGRVEVVESTPSATVPSAFDDFRTFESLIELYPSLHVPVEFSWFEQGKTHPLRAFVRAFGSMKFDRARMTRNVPFSHLSFQNAEYDLWLEDASLTPELPFGHQIEVSLNPNGDRSPHSGSTNAVPLSRGRINRDTVDGSFHVGWMCRAPQECVFKFGQDLDVVVDGGKSQGFLASMLAIPETAERIVFHVPPRRL